MAGRMYLDSYLDTILIIVKDLQFVKFHSGHQDYLDKFLCRGIENLPFELQRNFTLMRDLDQRTQDLMKEIDTLSEDYVSGVREMNSGERTDHLKKIEVAFSKSKEYVDDKVQLAMQTYEMVDKHIRKLDSDLARFEMDLKEQKAKEAGLSDYEEDVTPPKKGRGRTSKRKGDEPAKKKKKRDTSPVKSLGVTATLFSPEVVQVLDMPVDPNEPTYCICHQVSYGEMIGCDNIECPIEWFHFPCVGLTAKPKGKWYCPKCAQERKKK